MKAVIISGGLGMRLRPVTYEIPKPLIPIQGITLTEHVIKKLKEGGVDEIWISIGYMADKVKKYFGNGLNFGLKIHYLIEDEPLGTGGWLNLINRINEDFFVVNGDVLFDLDMEDFLTFHKERKSTISVAVMEVSNPSSYGMTKLSEDFILEYVEKPSSDKITSNFVNSGYYIFSAKVFDHVPLKKVIMLEKDILPLLAEKRLLRAFKSKGQWFDTGTFERWEQAIKEWKKI